jgi:hypothetical protein
VDTKKKSDRDSVDSKRIVIVKVASIKNNGMLRTRNELINNKKKEQGNKEYIPQNINASAHILVALLVVTLSEPLSPSPSARTAAGSRAQPCQHEELPRYYEARVYRFLRPLVRPLQVHPPRVGEVRQGLKNLVRIGAVNADQHKDIGSTFGFKGFHHIKYWGAGEKKGMKPTTTKASAKPRICTTWLYR